MSDDGYARRLMRLDEYTETVARALPQEISRFWSASPTDALAIGLFLDLYGRETIVLDIGTFVGVSAMWFAEHPNVARVVSVDPNPRIADEVGDKSDVVDFEAYYEKLGETRVFDVARAALAAFPEEERKIHLTEGVVGTSQIEVRGEASGGMKKVEVPRLDPDSDGLSLVAFVDGLHTDEGVCADLHSVYEASPHAVALLHDCRGEWAKAVKKGAKDFISAAKNGYAFEMVGPLGAGFGYPNMGVVFPENYGSEVQGILAKMKNSAFLVAHLARSEARDPLGVLRMSVDPRFLKKAAKVGASAVSEAFGRRSKGEW